MTRLAPGMPVADAPGMSTFFGPWRGVPESSRLGSRSALATVWRSPIVLVGLIGCTNGGHEMTSEEFISARGAAICASVLTCPEQLHRVYPSDLALSMTERCADVAAGGIDDLEALLSRGHTRADAREAERCLVAIATCSLAESRCERALVGTLPGGALCVYDEECGSGHCDGDGGLGASCGQCSSVSARAKRGEECRSSIDCEQPADVEVSCLPNADFRSVCTQVSTSPVGQSCAAPGRVCEAGAYCDVGGTCRLPVAARQACADGDRCASGSLCTGREAPTCVPVTLRNQGESCSGEDFDVASDGTFQRCDRTLDLHCDDRTRTCVQLTRAPSGESCGQQPCQEGLFCDETVRCAPLRLVGQPCRGGLECESHRCSKSVCVDLEESACR